MADKKKKGFIAEFREFINRGSVMDLAIGVIIGGAFGAIVNSLVADIIMPLLGAITGGVSFAEYGVEISEGNILAYGSFIQAVIDFVLIALVIFLLVKGINNARAKVEARKKAEEEAAPAAPAGPTQEELLAEIRDLLKNQK